MVSLWIFFIIYFICAIVIIIANGELLQTFRTKYNLEEPFVDGQRGLTYKQEMIPTVTKYQEFTACFRLRMDFFTIIGDYIPLLELLDGGGWENGVEVTPFQERTIDFRIRDPLTNKNLFRVTTFVDKIAEMREIGNRDWQWPPLTNPINILDWNHICFSYNVATRHMKLIVNGQLEVSHVRPIQVADLEDYIPSQWFGPNLDGNYTGFRSNVSVSIGQF